MKLLTLGLIASIACFIDAQQSDNFTPLYTGQVPELNSTTFDEFVYCKGCPVAVVQVSLNIEFVQTLQESKN